MGTPLRVTTGPDTFPQAGTPTLGPRGAAAKILAAFLGCAVFVVYGGEAQNEAFSLNAVRHTWATPGEPLDYPVASILESEITVGGQLVPFPLEETIDRFSRDTVLWKSGETMLDFQVDFFLNTEAHREAVEAQLPTLFNPGEGYGGILLSGHPRYFYTPLRATLMGFELINDEGTAFNRERRIRAKIRGDIDEVQLRCAVTLQPVLIWPENEE